MRTRYTDFLPDAQAVAESAPAPFARLLILIVAALVAAAIGWSAFAQVEQVATAEGVVRPAGKVKVINHPDGGRVAVVLVAEGDRVDAGDELIQLDPELIREEIAKRRSEWQFYSAEASRLAAEASGGQPNFDPTISRVRPDLVRTQSELYHANSQSLTVRSATADRIIDQRARDAARLAAREKQLVRSLAILKEQESAIATLTKKGYFPRVRYLSIRRQVSELEGQVEETRESRRGARSALGEARSRRASIDEEARSDALGRLAISRRERDRAKSSLSQEMARLRNLALRAPTAGIIQNMNVTSPGQAIRANEPLMNIVPTGAQLVIEALVSNDDIGYVRLGQQVTVKIRTYDFVRFGTLDGIVERVAPDAVADEDTGKLRFKVMIRTDRAHLGSGPGDYPVNPGMEADVDLHIGRRSILSYLTDRPAAPRNSRSENDDARDRTAGVHSMSSGTLERVPRDAGVLCWSASSSSSARSPLGLTSSAAPPTPEPAARSVVETALPV